MQLWCNKRVPLGDFWHLLAPLELAFFERLGPSDGSGLGGIEVSTRAVGNTPMSSSIRCMGR